MKLSMYILFLGVIYAEKDDVFVRLTSYIRSSSECSICLVYAWDVGTRYVHDYQTTWSADDGYHRGTHFFSDGRRYIRAGDDYVKWDQFSGIGWGEHLAMTFHAFNPDTNSCNNLKVNNLNLTGSNLPSVSFYTTLSGCEVRAKVSGTPTIGTNYYFQSVFEDLSSTKQTKGEIVVNSYKVGLGGSGPFHGKFCVDSTSLSTPNNQGKCVK